jgi:hypothetical protein
MSKLKRVKDEEVLESERVIEPQPLPEIAAMSVDPPVPSVSKARLQELLFSGGARADISFCNIFCEAFGENGRVNLTEAHRGRSLADFNRTLAIFKSCKPFWRVSTESPYFAVKTSINQ